MFTVTNDVLTRFWSKFVNYLPDFFGGLLILLIGLFLATFLKKLLLTLFRFFRIDSLLNKTKLIREKEVRFWEIVLVQLLRWTVIILFLVPTLEAWGLSRATAILNQFLFYLPNIIVAVIIGFAGIIVSNLTHDIIKKSVKTLGSSSSGPFAIFGKSSVLFFTILVMLNQLGIAQDLIRIFFTGVVAMLALAGGIAFGLGGRNTAQEIIENLKRKFK